jgi:hypothetical protein
VSWGQLPLVRERDHVVHARVGQREALRARVQLDAARARVQAAGRLRGGPAARVHAAEGGQPATRARGGGQRGVVGVPVAVRLVHGEHHAARPRALQVGDQLGGRLAEAVGVVGADVRVGVDEVEPPGVRQQAVEPGAQEAVDVHHGGGHPTAGVPRGRY